MLYLPGSSMVVWFPSCVITVLLKKPEGSMRIVSPVRVTVVELKGPEGSMVISRNSSFTRRGLNVRFPLRS